MIPDLESPSSHDSSAPGAGRHTPPEPPSPSAPPSRPRLRTMTEADLPRVQAVEESAFSQPWSLESFRALLTRPGALAWVLELPATEGGPSGPSILGHSVLWIVGDEAELANIALDEDVRGQGLGKVFLDAILEEARERGVRRVYLEVRASNTPALRLYASRGFQTIGRRPGYYTRPIEDAWVLMKEL